MTTIRAARILPAAGAPVMGATALHIADGRIADVVPVDPASLTAAEARLIILPALSDAHDHGRGLATLAYGAADQPLETWLPDLTRQPRIDPYLNAAVAFGRLAESGVAAVNHCHNTQDGSRLLEEAEAVSRAARDVGIAVAFAWPFFDRNAAVYGPLDELVERLPEAERPGFRARSGGFRSLERNMAMFEQARAFEHSLFTLQYHPVAPQWVEDATLAAIAEASAADGRRIHTHLLETERQREWADAHYSGGIVRFLDAIGLLSPRLTVAHAVWLRADECALLAERGVTVSINASSNLRLRSGIAPVSELLAAEAAIAIGLDGMSLDDDQDMLRELRLAQAMFGRTEAGKPAFDAARVLHANQIVGRRSVLGEDGGGQIAIGAPADLLALDFARLAADCVMPHPDPLPLVIGRAGIRHVVTLIVQGREVVRNGTCVGIDLPRLEADLTRQARITYAAHPPVDTSIRMLREALQTFYADGCHVHLSRSA